MMVELLAGPLVGGAHKDKRTAKNWGNLVIAINPALLGDAATRTLTLTLTPSPTPNPNPTLTLTLTRALTRRRRDLLQERGRGAPPAAQTLTRTPTLKP